MADIRITQDHALSQGDARKAAQQIAEQMARDYEVSSEWQGDVLVFGRGGVSGSLKLEQSRAELEVSLGMLFRAFKPMLEEKLASKMRKVFAA